MLTNPYTGGKSWFHGSPYFFNHFSDESHPDYDSSENDKHWNTHLGAHFTSRHHVAEDFVSGPGQVVHAHLEMKNPKHYDSEHHMDAEAFHRAWHDETVDNHPDDEDAWHEQHTDEESNAARDHDVRNLDPSWWNARYSHHLKDVNGHGMSKAVHWLSTHPRSHDIAWDFQKHLEKQGHDGVTYGNMIEGPKGHVCAVPFDHDAIHIHSRDETDQNTDEWPHCSHKSQEDAIAQKHVDEQVEPSFPKPVQPPEPEDHRQMKLFAMKSMDHGGLVRSAGGYLHNPYHEDDAQRWDWYHGSRTQHDDLSAGVPLPGRQPGTGGPQSNKLMGTHFSPLYHVGRRFAPGGSLYVARLKMDNPKHFESERDLDYDLAQYGVHHPLYDNKKFADGAGWTGYTHPDKLKNVMRGVGDNPTESQRHAIGRAFDSQMTWHPHQNEIVSDYAKSLKRQGHDGITYGNEVEGPKRHISAIATDPSTIEIQRIHRLPGIWEGATINHGHDLTPEHQVEAHQESQEMLHSIDAYHRQRAGLEPRHPTMGPIQ